MLGKKWERIKQGLLLGLDFFFEQLELALAEGRATVSEFRSISARHAEWRHAHGMRRRDALFIPLEGGASRICLLCGATVNADDWSAHLDYHHLPSTADLSGR